MYVTIALSPAGNGAAPLPPCCSRDKVLVDKYAGIEVEAESELLLVMRE